jgi:arylformamidase
VTRFLYRGFRSQAEIDAEYNLGARLADPQAVFDRYRRLSAAARKALHCALDVRFGPTLDERLDVFPAARPGAPVLLFIHGGYWRMLSQGDFSFVASGLVPHGVTVAVSNYSLCPKVTISEISRQSRAVIAWLHAHAARYNGDPRRIHVMGHSAGAQQAAMVLGTDWRGDYGLPADAVRGAVAVSGVYDLEPLRHSFLQPTVQLDHELVQRESPLLNIPRRAPPLHLFVGEREPAEFIRQARDYQRAWKAAGLKANYAVIRNVDHFSIIDAMARPDSAFCRRVLATMRPRRGR